MSIPLKEQILSILRHPSKTVALTIVSFIALLPGTGAAPSSNLPPRSAILSTATLVNDYWIANNGLDDAAWSSATYYTGNQRFHEITTNAAYLVRAVDWATANGWLRSEKSRYNGDVVKNDEDADNHCCGQTYIDLYRLDPQSIRIADIVRLENYIVSQPDTDYWSWIDAFYMQAPTLAKLSTLTTNPAYSDKLWAMYNDTRTTQSLFDATEGLWYRDSKYIYPAETTSGGNKVFWARGNGWMMAGLCRVIDALPADAPHRNDYIAMVQTMAAKLAQLQQPDGFWRSSLYEPTQFDMPETSGTSFYTYAMAWCMNNGYLDRDTYLPIVAKAWNGLVAESVHPDGFLGYVQLVAAAPGASYYNDTKAYGVGAFLLAASELSILAETLFVVSAGPDQTVYDFDRDGFEGVTLDASWTHDPDNTAEVYEWLDAGPLVIASGITAQVTLPLGVHDITLRITDNATNTWEDVVRITIAEPVPEQVYMERFDNPTGDTPLDTYTGWTALLTENGIISSYTNQSRALGVASGAYGFYAPKQDDGAPWNDAVPNQPALVRTDAPEAVNIESLASISWDASADNIDHQYRVAIEIGGVWYASNPALNDGIPDSAAPADLPLTYHPASFTTASNWLTIGNTTLGAPGSLSLGAAPASDLAGQVTGFGLYLVSGTDNEVAGDHVRFDNFGIWATPERPIAPLITSFRRVGGATWELTITGNAGTGYAFYSSLELTAPGTLVTTLGQADPSGDAGTVTGGSVLTTDASGNGRVRMTLTDTPANFVKVQPAP
ncbi:Unsaturated rhamnogalacturonyl hydrolase YteR [Pontiella desulfatans]|uniref:Unsaturated rhamnogalacturonyl hydrolase YteR n=1 Tax=Pontiella desulfatans TaxID=2750659 RepID=A0A6C2TXY5_PONDE|nr:glycoside hydrolase family 88 protein [Pontiella desulfatans]VGO12530.1 Unsaturated rhamnogalacturonyl hydrolase YteR [Pontiella desulfatans]